VRFPSVLSCLAAVVLLAGSSLAQAHQRDPLTAKEVDQLRETAQEPEKRLKLMVEFTRARLQSLEQLRADPKAGKDRGDRMHDLLQDIASLVDEHDDNVDDYNQRNADLRKPLKIVIEMDTELQNKLRLLNTAAEDPKNAGEAADYKFALQDAMGSVNQSSDTSRKLLDEQNVKFAKKKK
jgi:D-serine deaminase-like pyridoxal phosphate-dependent protein